MKKAATDNELSETKMRQREYWTALKEYVADNGNPFKMQKPSPQHWSIIALGRSGFQLSLTVNSQKKIIAVSFEINTDNAEDNKKYFDALKQDYETQASTAISPNLSWQRLDDKRVSLVQLSANFDFMDSSKQSDQFAWFFEYVNKFIKFFRPKIKNL